MIVSLKVARAQISFRMKKFYSLIFCAILAISTLNAKDVKISVVPEDAKIFVDGNYVGDGIITTTVKGDFINLKLEAPGYVTIHTKFYKSDKRKAVSYTLRKDTFYEASEQSDLANNYFTITVNKEFYTTNEDGSRDDSKAWKMVHQILLNYFDEIQSSDLASGFVQTPWVYKAFPEADVQARVRVTVSEGNIGGALSYKIKIASETAGLNATHKDENFKANDRLLKKYESLIEEFQTRLGEKN